MANNTLSDILALPNVTNAQKDPTSSSPKDPLKEYDALFIAYLLILQSVQINSKTSQIQAKELENNAQQQNEMIGQENQCNYELISNGMIRVTVTVKLPTWTNTGPLGWHETVRFVREQVKTKVTTTMLQEMAEKNEEISAIRNVIEDQLNIVQQASQIASTNINTTVSDAEQAIQQGSSMLKMLNSLTNQISQM